MTTSPNILTDDRALKDAHRAVWTSGDYPAVAADVIAELGPTIVAAAAVRQGDRVLDVAAGSGNASLPAARTGAAVTASDLAPRLLDVGRGLAEAAGLDIAWDEADAEALPYADGTFDVALSCVGIMFAPHHQRAADELVRVVRPGGRIALVNWTPEGFIGRMFAAMKPYAAPAPAGVQPPPLWGDVSHVTELLGERVDLHTERRVLGVDRFAEPAEFLEFFKRCYGPTIAIYNRIAASDPAQAVELDRVLVDLAADYVRPGTSTMDWEYLLVTGTVR